jgi:hypothetical protein
VHVVVMQLPLFEADSRVDPDEAPEGYYASPKVYLGENICRQCDWRSECQKDDTDFTNHNHRCMGYPVVTPEGQTIARNDGCSVVFKRR